MATLSNETSHSATLANEATSPTTFGQHTIAELGSRTMADLGPHTFNEQYIIVTNDAAHTASMSNEAAH